MSLKQFRFVSSGVLKRMGKLQNSLLEIEMVDAFRIELKRMYCKIQQFKIAFTHSSAKYKTNLEIENKKLLMLQKFKFPRFIKNAFPFQQDSIT